MFPPVPIQERAGTPPVDFVWSDFDGTEPWEGYESVFLDFEYIYDPKNFQGPLEGKKWKTFRKNARKWPKAHEGFRCISSLAPEHYNDEVRILLADWGLRKLDEAEDFETMMIFALRPPPGVGHFYVIDEKGELASVSVWDRNWKFINYRFLIVRKDGPKDAFLDEFSRLAFHRYCAETFPGTLINDGGTLGKPGLERFKDKLHPIRKRRVYSWRNTHED